MRALEEIEQATGASNVVLCVANDGYEIDLKLVELYQFLPDESLEPEDMRVIDETGEDYIYPANYFISADDIAHERSVL